MTSNAPLAKPRTPFCSHLGGMDLEREIPRDGFRLDPGTDFGNRRGKYASYRRASPQLREGEKERQRLSNRARTHSPKARRGLAQRHKGNDGPRDLKNTH